MRGKVECEMSGGSQLASGGPDRARDFRCHIHLSKGSSPWLSACPVPSLNAYLSPVATTHQTVLTLLWNQLDLTHLIDISGTYTIEVFGEQRRPISST